MELPSLLNCLPDAPLVNPPVIVVVVEDKFIFAEALKFPPLIVLVPLKVKLPLKLNPAAEPGPAV